jgi:hypothetical protein
MPATFTAKGILLARLLRWDGEPATVPPAPQRRARTLMRKSCADRVDGVRVQHKNSTDYALTNDGIVTGTVE